MLPIAPQGACRYRALAMSGPEFAIAARFRFEAIVQAHQLVASGNNIGDIVL